MVYIHLATGFEEVEAITILDILRRAEVDAVFVSMEEELAVVGAHGIHVTADILFDQAEYDRCEMIVLPGGMPGTTNLQGHEGLCEQIAAFTSAGKWVCAICAAPMVLGSIGILLEREATIYPGMEEYLVGAKLSEEPVVRDGNIITSQAPGTAMLFALELVEVLKGEEVREAVRRDLYLAI